jgi:hypothetical protein
MLPPANALSVLLVIVAIVSQRRLAPEAMQVECGCLVKAEHFLSVEITDNQRGAAFGVVSTLLISLVWHCFGSRTYSAALTWLKTLPPPRTCVPLLMPG